MCPTCRPYPYQSNLIIDHQYSSLMDDVFKSILKLLYPKKSPQSLERKNALPRRNTLEFSLLGRLPPELIIQIANLLPDDSAAIFALSCRSMYYLLKSQFLSTPYRPNFLVGDQIIITDRCPQFQTKFSTLLGSWMTFIFI